MWSLSSEIEIDRADFSDWMTFLPYNLMEKINPNSEAFIANT